MMVMDELSAEPHRRTPSLHHVSAQSPRVGGCVGAFFHLFDWNPSKRLFSTKRLTAERPSADAVYASRDRGFKECRSFTEAKPLLINEGKQVGSLAGKSLLTLSSTHSPNSVKSDDSTYKRVPGVVARLMGLESLPDTECLSAKSDCNERGNPCPNEIESREQIDSPPVLLQELLRQELQYSKKSLKEKLPGFTKKTSESKSERGAAGPPRRKPTGHGRGNTLHPYVDSRAPKTARQTGKKMSPQQEEAKPFLARLQTGNPMLLPSKSQNSSSSPKLGSKNTARLLEAAVKILEPNMQPSPRSRYALEREIQRELQREFQRDLNRDTQSECGASSRFEKKTSGSKYGRPGSLTSFSTGSKSLRSQPLSKTWNGRDDRSEQSVRLVEPGLVETRSSHSRALTTTSGHSASPPRCRRSRPANSKRGDAGSPRAVLGTHEAATRGFRIDLGSQANPAQAPVPTKVDGSPLSMEAQTHNCDHPVIEHEAMKEKPSTPISSPLEDLSTSKVDLEEASPLEVPVSEANSRDEDMTTPPAVAKSVSGRGFRSLRFRSQSDKQEKDPGAQGNRVYPSEKDIVSQSDQPTLATPPKVSGTGLLSYSSRLFSTRKQADKKEGNDKGEALPLKRTDSNLMRSLLRRPSNMSSSPPKTKTQKTRKATKKVNVEMEVEAFGPQPVTDRETPQSEVREAPSGCLHKEGSVSPKSVDEVFPELPLEESDLGTASPDLGKTIRAVEDQFLGFGLQGETALFDCRSIERMFGKGVSRTFASISPGSSDLSSSGNHAPGTSPISPEVFITECGARGALSNSPLVNYEKMFFSSRSHPNLQELFEAISREGAPDFEGRRRSCSSSGHEKANADVDSCNHQTAVCDGLEVPNVPVDAGCSDDGMSPISFKKSAEKPRASLMKLDDGRVLGVDECGQPSPVSVLESPFLDEVSVTPDASLAGSENQLEESVDESCTSSAVPSAQHDMKGSTQVTEANSACVEVSVTLPEIIETDKIKQAIMDISRFRNIDVTSIGLEPPRMKSVAPEEEQNYIREVLDAASLLAEDTSIRDSWYGADTPMHPALFDRLEFGSIKLDDRTLMESKRWGDIKPDQQRQGSNIRSERKLLFDCVNEILMLEPWMKTSSLCIDMPMFPEMSSNSKFRVQVFGEALVREVHGTICHWQSIAGNVLDDLIDYDMSVTEGKWVNFHHDVADIGFDIEHMLLKVMIEELVGDLSSTCKTQGRAPCSAGTSYSSCV